MGGDDVDSVSSYQLKRICACWLDFTDGVHIVHASSRFFVFGKLWHLKASEDMFVIWGVPCLLSYFDGTTRKIPYWAVQASGHHSLDDSRSTRFDTQYLSHRPLTLKAHFSPLPPISPPCATLTPRTTHNGSTPRTIPIHLANPPPSPPTLPSHTSTTSTSPHPLHHK